MFQRDPGDKRFGKGAPEADAKLPTAVRICLIFSWFLIKQPNIKHITQKPAGEFRWSSAFLPSSHQACLHGEPSPWGRTLTPALCLPRQLALTRLPFVLSLYQLLSHRRLAFAGSRWPRPGSLSGRAPHPDTYPLQGLPHRASRPVVAPMALKAGPAACSPQPPSHCPEAFRGRAFFWGGCLYTLLYLSNGTPNLPDHPARLPRAFQPTASWSPPALKYYREVAMRNFQRASSIILFLLPFSPCLLGTLKVTLGCPEEVRDLCPRRAPAWAPEKVYGLPCLAELKRRL